MKKLILYSYLKCSTCIKAAKWLDQNNFKYELIDIVENPPSYKFLDIALKQYSSNIKRIFNTKGKSFKSINCDINSSAKEKIIQLLHNDGKLIKRPFLIIEEKHIIVGFKESEYENTFLKEELK